MDHKLRPIRDGELLQRGQQLVEFALLLPLLLLLLMGIIEFGIAVFRYDTIANASREIARYGIVHPKVDENEQEEIMKQFVIDEMPRWTTGLISESLVITPTVIDSVWRKTVFVTVTYEHQFLTGPVIASLGGNPNIQLRAISTMYSE